MSERNPDEFTAYERGPGAATLQVVDIDGEAVAMRIVEGEAIRLTAIQAFELGRWLAGGDGDYELAFRAFEQGVHAGSTGRADAGTSPAEDRVIFNNWWGLEQARRELG